MMPGSSRNCRRTSSMIFAAVLPTARMASELNRNTSMPPSKAPTKTSTCDRSTGSASPQCCCGSRTRRRKFVFVVLLCLRVPVFLAALVLVRGVPALLYRPLVGSRRAIVAGLLQATSLSFIVAASQIGMELGLITKATGAALIAAGLLSVLIFPLLALTILRRAETVSTVVPKQV